MHVLHAIGPLAQIKAAAEAPKFSSKEVLEYLENLPDADQVADLVSCALLPGHLERQTILGQVAHPMRGILLEFGLAFAG